MKRTNYLPKCQKGKVAVSEWMKTLFNESNTFQFALINLWLSIVSEYTHQNNAQFRVYFNVQFYTQIVQF
jgi:hypothetical protein